MLPNVLTRILDNPSIPIMDDFYDIQERNWYYAKLREARGIVREHNYPIYYKKSSTARTFDPRKR